MNDPGLPRPRPSTGPPVALVVMAKSPVAGLVKTRLCPPLSGDQAARLASAALVDTLGQVNVLARGCAQVRPVLALAGDLVDAQGRQRLRDLLRGAPQWTIIPQYGPTFADRLAHAHQAAGRVGMTFQIGMDTPQVTGEQLASGVQALIGPQVDAVLGPASDGGWWALGLRRPAFASVLRHVPMSTSDTAERTVAALRGIGLRIAFLDTLTDVDTVHDAHAVARSAPHSLFARTLTRMTIAVAAGDPR